MDIRLAWIAAKFVSSKRETRYASAAVCRAITAEDWKRKSAYIIKRLNRFCWNLFRAYPPIHSNFTDEPLKR
jgi:hypothetical protein